MRKGWKKAVSTMLCAAMILSMSSFVVSADGEAADPQTPPTVDNGETENNDGTDNGGENNDQNDDGANDDQTDDGTDDDQTDNGSDDNSADDSQNDNNTNNDQTDDGADNNNGNPPADGDGQQQPSDSLPMTELIPAAPAAENGIMPMDENGVINSEEELRKALEGSDQEIVISGSISLTSPLTISREVTIKGENNATLTSNFASEENFITVTANNVTLQDITITSGANNKYAVHFYKVTDSKLSGVTISHGSDKWAPVLVNGSSVEIDNSTMTTSSYAQIELAKGNEVSAKPTVTYSGAINTDKPLVYVAQNDGLSASDVEVTVNGNTANFQVDENGAAWVGNDQLEQGKVATVDGVSYPTLQLAIDNATNGATVVLNKNTTENVTVAENQNIILDLGTFTLSGGNGNSGKAAITNNGTLTIKGSGTVKREDNDKPSYYVIDNQGTMTIEGGNIYNNSGAPGGGYGSSLIRNGGTSAAASSHPVLNIQGGTLQQNNFIAVKNDDYGTLKVSGGTIISNEQAIQNWNQATITGGTMQGNVYTWSWGMEGYTPTTKISGGIITGNVMAVNYNDADETPKVEIIAGEIRGTLGTGYGDQAFTQNNSAGDINVAGGDFGYSVSEEYLDDSLTAELYSQRNPDAPYSYYPSVEDAKAHAMPGDIVKDLKNNTSITIPGNSTDTDRPSGSHNTGSSSSSSSNSNVSYHRDPEQDKRDAVQDMWKRAINKINSARDGSSLKIYTGIIDEIPDYVLDALRENNVTVTFYNQDGDEVTIPAGMAPKSLRDSWTYQQLGNYVLSADEVVTEVEETTEATQPAAEQNAPATETAKPNPETGDASSSMMAIAAAAASLCGVVLLSKKNK